VKPRNPTKKRAVPKTAWSSFCECHGDPVLSVFKADAEYIAKLRGVFTGVHHKVVRVSIREIRESRGRA
jgi:hypothetical protein